MDYAFIIAIVALLIALFAIFRVYTFHNILVARIEKLKEMNRMLEHKLPNFNSSTGNRTSGKREGRSSAVNEPVAQVREPKEQRQQPQQQRPPKEQRQSREQQQARDQQQPREQRQQPNQNQPRQPKEQRQQGQQPNLQEQQPKKKKENRRRNEPMERQQPEQEKPRHEEQLNPENMPLEMQLETDHLLEFETVEQEPTPPPVQQEETYAERKYAIIPEDGIIRQHQLQVQPDSDSYLEVDMPAYGKSNMTRYRFNMGGNHAFVIAQGIDRLENAFSFAKPSNRKVSQVVHQEDGVLEKTDNGWRIYEKAKIDFR
ncbi:hypothetical protein [Botryobacter ruber]|uniref:hypothetical protein n=1 Tax=Botryobacter ruber TaxID=2171629 RepID=UPI000E09FCFA|nr:hypothetical protein [Botryobacter ruber]